MIEAISTWANELGAQYGVNPWIFASIYVGAIPLFLASIDGHSTKLKGLSPIPLGGLMGYSFAEHVWLDA